MDRGYIKSWRKAEDSGVFKDAYLWQLWSWCLWKASWKTKTVTQRTGKGITFLTLNPGQFIFGRKSAAQQLGCPESSIRNRMAKLEKLGNVDIQVDTHWSIVTICNWELYQSEYEVAGQASGHAEDRQRTGKGHKEEGKEGKKEPKPSSPEALRLAGVLADSILRTNPKHRLLSNGKRAACLSSWAADIEKLNRIDGQEWGDIERVLVWCQADSFWQKNILSGAKFREKYDTLAVRSMETKETSQWSVFGRDRNFTKDGPTPYVNSEPEPWPR